MQYTQHSRFRFQFSHHCCSSHDAGGTEHVQKIRSRWIYKHHRQSRTTLHPKHQPQFISFNKAQYQKNASLRSDLNWNTHVTHTFFCTNVGTCCVWAHGTVPIPAIYLNIICCSCCQHNCIFIHSLRRIYLFLIICYHGANVLCKHSEYRKSKKSVY